MAIFLNFIVLIELFASDTKFEDCPKCKEVMPLFQEAAGYLDTLEDDQVINLEVIFYVDCDYLYNMPFNLHQGFVIVLFSKVY